MSSTARVPTSTLSVRDAVVAAVAGVAGVPAAEIDPDADLRDLGIDSLDFSSILLEYEDLVGAEVPIEVLDAFGTQATLSVHEFVRVLSP